MCVWGGGGQEDVWRYVNSHLMKKSLGLLMETTENPKVNVKARRKADSLVNPMV